MRHPKKRKSDEVNTQPGQPSVTAEVMLQASKVADKISDGRNMQLQLHTIRVKIAENQLTESKLLIEAAAVRVEEAKLLRDAAKIKLDQLTN